MKPKDETVGDALKRYIKALEAGKAVADSDSLMYQDIKSIFDLGGGDLTKGMEIYSNILIKKHEQDIEDNPALALGMRMMQSDNPVHRAFAKTFANLPIPNEEFKELLRKALAEEEKEEAKMLPSIPKLETIEDADSNAGAGKYDELCKKWVNHSSVPYQNKNDFLAECAPTLPPRTFERILKDAYRRGVIDKAPNGRYKPKNWR